MASGLTGNAGMELKSDYAIVIPVPRSPCRSVLRQLLSSCLVVTVFFGFLPVFR